MGPLTKRLQRVRETSGLGKLAKQHSNFEDYFDKLNHSRSFAYIITTKIFKPLIRWDYNKKTRHFDFAEQAHLAEQDGKLIKALYCTFRASF